MRAWGEIGGLANESDTTEGNQIRAGEITSRLRIYPGCLRWYAWNCRLPAMTRRRASPVTLPEVSCRICTAELRYRLLSENPLFAELSADDLEKVNARFAVSGFETGETIQREGDPARQFWIVVSGVIKLFRTTESGASVLIDFLVAGDHFGSIAGYGSEACEETVVTLSSVCALSLGVREFHSILREHPPVALRAVEVLSDRLRLAHNMVHHLGGYPARARIAYILLRLVEKLGTPWEGSTLIQAPLSREDIASMAGTATETASRVLSAFQKEGAVLTGREWVAVVDPEALEAAAPDAAR